MVTPVPIDNPIVISREELYRQVWTEPMTKLAPRYGLSDVGLAKVCRKYNIPRPPVGHWAKVSVEQHVERTELPKLDDESLQEIRFFRHQFFGDAAILLDSNQEKIAVFVAERLSNPHPLIAQLKEIRGEGDVAGETSGKYLDVRVSKASHPRALRILDAVIKKWEELGGRVWIDQNTHGDGGTRFAIDQDAVSVVMAEESELIDKTTKYSYGRNNDRKYTGRLVLEISGRWAEDLRKRWADGKKQQLENVLGSFLLGLKKWIAHEMECRLDNECEARQKQRAEQVRKERAEQQQRMLERSKNLEACAENWSKSRLIREYITGLESTIESGLLRPSCPEQFPEWLNWAKWYADSLDPLTPTPKREEYKDSPINLPVGELDLTRRTKSIVQSLGVVDADGLFRLDRRTVHAASNRFGWRAWSEIGCVLEGLRYDVSDRGGNY